MQRLESTRAIVVVIGLMVILVLGLLALSGKMPRMAGIPNTGGSANTAPKGVIGKPFAAAALDQNGCPQQITTHFSSDQSIFVGFTESQIPQGTYLYARIYEDGLPLEDSNPITAEEDTTACVWFEFRPGASGPAFDPGSYSADLFVNEYKAGQVSFVVSSPGQGNTSQDGSIQLGRLTTTTRVDNNSCPIGSVSSFSADQNIHIAYTESTLPANTEIFSRLLYQGQPILDSEPIQVQQERQGCISFTFQGKSASAFQSGPYEARVYVNGNQADQVQFEVR